MEAPKHKEYTPLSEIFRCYKHILSQLDNIHSILTERNDLEIQHTFLGVGNNTDENLIFYEIQKTIYKIKKVSIDLKNKSKVNKETSPSKSKTIPPNKKNELLVTGEEVEVVPNPKEKKEPKKQPKLPQIQKPLFQLVKKAEINLSFKKDITALTQFGDKIIIGSKDGNICVYKINTHQGSSNITLTKHCDVEHYHKDMITCFLSINNKTCATGSMDGQIVIWELDSNKPMKFSTKINAHANGVRKIIQYQQEQSQFMSCGEDSQIKIWEFKTLLKQIKAFKIDNYSSPFHSVLLLQSKRDIIIVSTSESLLFYNLTSHKIEGNIPHKNVFSSHGMIELANGNVVVATYEQPYSLCLIDPKIHKVIEEKQIDLFTAKGSPFYSSKYGLLCAYDNYLTQLDINCKEFGFSENISSIKGSAGIICINNMIVIPNANKGLTYFTVNNQI
jgi:WD40 repeat protein